jgi:phosphoadenosine phosphosulfate reductase
VKIYKKQTVYEAALDRIRYIFDEFPNIVVGYSGGKDSTVVFELAMIVAKEKNRLPLKVMWIDQELEWKSTVEQVKHVMYNPDVEPMWLQIPMKILNASSGRKDADWLHCWAEGEEWARERDPISIKENKYGTDRFGKLFDAVIKTEFEGVKTAILGGVRTEESPTRFTGLTNLVTYKWITWGKRLEGKDHYTFYPLYDWSYIDIWKAIHDNGWRYSTLYDELYRYGVPVRDMRVSNIHHETAVRSLFFLQEIEPDTYEAATKRISGLDTAGKMGQNDFFIRELPFMFVSWKEYRDYLLEKLIESEDVRKGLRKEFDRMEFYAEHVGDELYKLHIQSIITNDLEYTKLKNWENGFQRVLIRRKIRGEKVYD